MKKIIALLCIIAMLLCAFASCEEKESGNDESEVFTGDTYSPIERKEIKYEKIGEASVKPENTYKSGDIKEIGVTITGVDESGVLSLKVGKKAALSYKLSPEKPAITAVYWESSNEKIVKVDKDGNILGMAPGCATIACTTVLGFSDTVKVYVYEYQGNEELSNQLVTLLNDARAKALSGSDAAADEGAETAADEGAETTDAAEKTDSAADGETAVADPLAQFKFKTDDISLQHAANQRVYEEACEGKMDSTRPDFYGLGKDRQHTTILTDYDIHTRGSTCLNGIWGEYTAEQVAEILLSSEDSKKMIMDTNYEYISVGCFKNGEVTYWLVMMIIPF